MGSKFIIPKIALLWAKMAVAVLLVAMLIRRIHLQEITAYLRAADLRLIGLAFLLLPLNLFFQYSRWHKLARLAHPAARNRDIFSSLLFGITLGFITPGRVGEFGRAFFIPAGQWPRLVGLTLIDKLFALMMLFLLGLLGMIPFLQKNAQPIIWVPLYFSAFVLLTLVFILLLYPQLATALIVRRGKRWEKHAKIGQMVSSLELITTATSLKITGYALGQVLTYSLQFYLLILSIHSTPFFPAMAAVTTIMWVKTMLPISIGDLGVRETAAIFFLGQLGVPQAAAFDASMLLFAINVLLPALAGMMLLLKNHSLEQIRF
jgi:uncharacterized membrane protein YbhN (UPF0104 family)